MDNLSKSTSMNVDQHTPSTDCLGDAAQNFCGEAFRNFNSQACAVHVQYKNEFESHEFDVFG